MPQYIGRRLIIPNPPQTAGAIGQPGPRRSASGRGRTTASRCGTAQGIRGGYGRFEFKDLKLKTKYKVLIPDENFVRSKSGNTRVSTYYDITRFCKPQGSSRIVNNFSRLGSFSAARRTYSNSLFGYSWGGTDFLSDSQGELSLSIFWHAFWRRSSWNRSALYTHNSQILTEEVRSTIIILPVSELTSAGNGLYTVNATNSVNPNPNPITLSPTNNPGMTLQDISFDFIQTFDLDVNKLDNVEEVDITDISLFFKLKPRTLSNSSGVEKPGVSVFLVDVENGQPQVDTHYIKSAVKIPYDNITTSSDASAVTKFSFEDPITLRTGRQYGIAIDFEDRGYLLWDCKVGDRKRGTNSVSPGPKKEYRGGLFGRSNSRRNFNNTSSLESFKQLTTTELKFAVSVAEYDVATDMTLIINNNNDEIISLDTVTASADAADGGSKFFVGETVYVEKAAENGTVNCVAGLYGTALIGTGTDFTALLEDEVIILVDTTNPEKKEEVKIAQVYSATAVILSEPVMETIAGSYIRTMTGEVTNYSSSNEFLYLSDSTANATNFILDNAQGTRTGSTVIGVESGVSANVAALMDVPVSAFSADMDIVLPANYVIQGTYSFANTSNLMSPPVELNMDATNMIANNTAFVLSRSSEFAEASGPFSSTAGGGTKSANIALTIQYTGPQDLLSLESPTINIEDINISTTQWIINNDATDEHTQYGNTESKHISKTLTFGEGNSAEDIRVIYNAYRPAGTDVQCFAKIINSEDPGAFDEKSWTKLELKSASEFSQTNQYFDFREFEFGFPSFPPTASTLAGTVTTTLNSVNVTGTTLSGLVVGDVIRIYSPLFPNENYGIFSVATATSDTAIVLSSNVANNNLVGDGLKIDKLTTPRTGFNNKENLNIVRYFGSDGEIYDTYSAVAIKTVLLSNSDTTVPKVDDYRVIGVSA
jgi:hypothetical protein